jgi:hypothetical protein
VHEFQVLSDGYSAGFGRAMGGIINTVTRSEPTNSTAPLTNPSAIARSTPPIVSYLHPKEWRHQAGGTVGGPIQKDKLFFFTNYELVKRNFPGPNRITLADCRSHRHLCPAV